MPLAAAPRLDDLGGDDVHQDFGECPPFGVAFQVIGGLVPAEVRVEHHRQEQIVAVVDDDDLAAGPFDGGVVDQVLLGAVRADVALERELAGDDLLDRDLLFPAVPAVALFAARFGDFLRAAQRALRLFGTTGLYDGMVGRRPICSDLYPGVASSDVSSSSPARHSAGTYISRTYSFTMRRALKRGSTVRIDCLTICSQRCGMPCASRS